MQSIITIILAVFASSGFWLFVQTIYTSRKKKRSAEDRLLMGIGFSKIADLGMRYIERGWVTKDEYNDLDRYLFMPYKEMGGNGTAERIMEQVKKLPFKEAESHEQ